METTNRIDQEKICDQLMTQVLDLLDDLLSICPDEPDVLLVRLFFETQVNPETLMKGFIKWVYPWKEEIQNRDERFFHDNKHIFGPLPQDKVEHFRQKILDGVFDEEDKDTIWDYFQIYVKLMDKYQKLK